MYLHFQSHHPTHVKRGLDRFLYDRVRPVYSGVGAEPGGGGGPPNGCPQGQRVPLFLHTWLCSGSTILVFLRSAAAAKAPREEVTVEESTTQEEENHPWHFTLMCGWSTDQAQHSVLC